MSLDVLAVVPARGGSKSIPRKNLAPLRGRPLLAYTADCAKGARSITRAVLSTDDEEIAAVGRSLGLEVPFLRPANLAGDDAPMLGVLLHAVDEHKASRGKDPDLVVLLQPTSPLRRALDVDACVALATPDVDSVVTVTDVPHRFTPGSLLRETSDGFLQPYGEAGGLRRQDKPALLARNGPAVVVTRPGVLRAGRLYGDRTRGHRMDAIRSLDVDEPEDLALAEVLLGSHLGGSV